MNKKSKVTSIKSAKPKAKKVAKKTTAKASKGTLKSTRVRKAA